MRINTIHLFLTRPFDKLRVSGKRYFSLVLSLSKDKRKIDLRIGPLFILSIFASASTCMAMQDSMLRPRVQLAQLRAEVDELLELTNTHSIAQIKRTIKELQTKLNTATAENTQLRTRLETQKQEFTQAQQRNKQLNQSLKELTVFKKKTSSHFEALRTLIDAVPDSVP